MDVREKLVELLNASPDIRMPYTPTEIVADRLIAHGVTVIPPEGIGEMSDGYHTFNELYHHRAVLFSVICNAMPDKAWKSKRHDTGDMYDGMFIVGIETNHGQATYHYDVDPYWDMFNVPELEYAPKWDGHTPQEAINRIANGVTVQEWYSASNPPKEDGTYLVQTNTGTITTARFYAFKSFPATKYLPACHRSASWQSNRNVVKWTYLPQPPKGE